MKTRLLIFRHGETEWNKEMRIQGHSDIPLNDSGRTQARELAQKLETYTIDRVVTSDLSRASETAAIALPQLPLHSSEALREAYMGEYEGVTRDGLMQRAGGELWRRWISFAHDDYDFALPGGENKREHQKRLREYLESQVKFFLGQTIAISTHGGSMRRILQLTRFQPPEKWMIHNCACHELQVEVTIKDSQEFFLWEWIREL